MFGMRRLILLFVLAGCAAAPLPAPPVPPPVVVETPPPPNPAVAVVKKFDAATHREPAVVLSGVVSADQIERVRLADKQARDALTRLGQQGKHPTPAALAAARDAVKALEDALAPSSPGPSAQADSPTRRPP